MGDPWCSVRLTQALQHYPDFAKELRSLLAPHELEALMRHALGTLLVIAGAIAIPAAAQQPLDADCSAAATQATGYTPGADSGPDGSRVAGAAKGAAAGAAVGAVQ